MTGIDASKLLIEVAQKHAELDKVVEKHVRLASTSFNIFYKASIVIFHIMFEYFRFGIRYENVDLLSFSGKHTEEFDLVVVSEVLEHVSNKEYFLKLCVNCLKVSHNF